MRSLRYITFGLSVAGLLFSGMRGVAQDNVPSDPPITRPWPATNADTLFVNDSLMVEWDKPTSPSRSYGIRDLVLFKVDPRWQVDTIARDVRVTVEITASRNPDHGNYDEDNDQDTLIIAEFMAGVRPWANAPASLSRLLDEQDADAKGYTDAHRLKMRLVHIEEDLGAGFHDIPCLPKSLRFDVSITYDRVMELARLEQGPAGSGWTLLDCSTNPVVGSAAELKIDWDPVVGAVEYDLEWTWVDDYPGAAPHYDLDRNSTRITTDKDFYRVPLLYDKGYIIYRVRAVGRDQDHPAVRVHTVWLGPTPTGPVIDADDFAIPVVSHQAQKNWQVTTTYAEEGKHKEVITYADGTLHPRQTVTRSNSLMVPIIGETIYDVVGRPAIEIMPVPYLKDVCLDDGVPYGRIDYVPDFNRAVGANSAEPITFLDLLAAGIDNCAVGTPLLDPINGAEYYYSEHYALDGVNVPSALLVPPPPFLPKAEGHPYAQKEYTKDNTGRIRSQSGVGEALKLGSEHETIIYYGKPEQIQLDRLFGTEAGYAHHYQKVVQVDPNGEKSVSYIDMTGKTVATALACDQLPDASLLPVEPSGSATLTTDLFNGLVSTDPLLEQLHLLPDGPAMVFTSTIPVACEGTYTFDYTVEQVILTDDCWGIATDLCVRCGYVLDIILEAECFPRTVIAHDLIGTITTENQTLNFSCTAPPLQLTPDPVDWQHVLPPGEYTLTKVLRLDPTTRDRYVAALLDPANSDCIETVDEIRTRLEGEFDHDCDVTCVECYEALVSVESFLAQGGTVQLYQDMLAECDDLCKTPSWCEVAYQNMLLDMDRHGQYCAYSETDDGVIIVTDRTSVLYPGNANLLSNPYRFQADPSAPGRHFDSGIDLWRQPWVKIQGTWYNEYRNDDNVRYKVPLIANGDGTFLPAVPLWLVEYDQLPDGTVVPYTYPERLPNVADFLAEWQPGFERSLLRYHPEYCYYENCAVYGEPFDPVQPYATSDGFDNLLAITETYDQAVNVTVGLLSPVSLPLPDSYAEVNFLAMDPFADATVYENYADELNDRFNNFMVVDGYTYSMAQAAAVYARCGGNFQSTAPDPDITWCRHFGDLFTESNTTTVPDVPAATLDQEWRNLRAYYLAEKYRIQKKRADDFVSTCDCSGLNYCIGEESTTGWWDLMHSPQTPLAYGWGMGGIGAGGYGEYYQNWLAEWNSQTGNMACQPCRNYAFYTDKVPRIADPQVMLNTTPDPMENAYQLFLQTGQCPMATAWQTLFQELAMGGHLQTAGTFPLASSAGWQSILLAGSDFTSALPASSQELTISATGATRTLNITQNGSSICLATLTEPTSMPLQASAPGGPSPVPVVFHWADIQYVAQVRHTSGANFELIVYLASSTPENATLEPITITGQMCAGFQLAPCNFPQTCQPNDFGLAWQELLNDLAQSGGLTTTAYLTDLDIPGSGVGSAPDQSVLQQVGSPIRSRFQGFDDQQWEFNAVAQSFTLRIDDYLNAPYYLLNNLATEPASEALSVYLGQAVHFGNLNSNYQNFFSVDVYNDAGDRICILTGQVWFQTVLGIEALPVGECDLPEPLACSGAANQTYPLLVNVLQERLLASPSTGYPGMDLWESPNMSASLVAQICPLCVTTSIPPVPDAPITGDYDVVFGVPTLNFNDCVQVQLQVGSIPPPYVFASFGTAELEGAADADGQYHAFSFQLFAPGNPPLSVGYAHVQTCFGLVACDPCPEPLPVQSIAQRWADGSLDSLKYLGILAEDAGWSGYMSYIGVVDSLNSRLGYGPMHPAHVAKLSYVTYRKRGYDKSLDAYLKYLRNYYPAIDEETYLAHIDSFVVQYGNGFTVEAEYERYQKAVFYYNERAVAAGKPIITALESYSSFKERLLSDKTFMYVAYLTKRTPTNTPPLSITSYLNWQENDDPCAVLYREQYLPAHEWLLAQSTDSTARCFGNEVFTPLASYVEFLESNLCCSDTGLVILEEYLQRFYDDTLKCPGDIPRLAFCDSTMSPVAHQKFLDEGDECQRLYIVWSELYAAYDTSDYYAHTKIPLQNYKTFADFESRGLCSCVQEYITYFTAYINWHTGDPKLFPILSIEEFCNPDENCCDWVVKVKTLIETDYPQSAYYALTNTTLHFTLNSCEEAQQKGYCFCLLNYANYLLTYTTWNGAGTPPPPVLELEDFCNGVEETCCGNTDQLEVLVGLYNDSYFATKHDCYIYFHDNPTCEYMVSQGLCHCLPDYIAYLQTYLPLAEGHAPVPCPIDLYAFCHGTSTDPCVDAFARYNIAVITAQPVISAYNTAHGTDYTFLTVLNTSLFNSSDLCFCVNEYVAQLEFLISAPDLVLAGLNTDNPLFDITKFCQAPVSCGPPDLPPFTPNPPAPEEGDPCEHNYEANLDINSVNEHNHQVEIFTRSLTDRYNTECMAAMETFTMEFTDTEHHYTLYYYDRAGNLVRTVPPEGVERKTFTQWDDPEALRIAADRADGTHTEFTEHRMPSDHVYNSLGQPTRMAMPDQDNMDITETGRTFGLPENLSITGSWFGAGGTGYLTGSLSGAVMPRGAAYTTSDGGVTWQRSLGLVGADLLGTHFITAVRGYAVGAHGTFLRTVDGGDSWDLIPNELLAGVQRWTDVVFRDVDNGVAVGDDGTAVTTDGGDEFAPTVLPGTDLTGVGYTGSDYVACGIADEQGIVLTAGDAGTFGAPIEFGSTAADLNCASSYATDKAFVGGDMGVLLHTADGGAEWNTLTTGMVMDFRALHFVDEEFGIAIVDSAISPTETRGVLHKTVDGGRSWSAAGWSNVDLHALQPVLASTATDYQECMAVGRNGLVWKLVLGEDLEGEETVGIMPITGPGSTLDVTAVWASWDQNTEGSTPVSVLRCAVGDANGNVYVRKNIGVAASWNTVTGMGAGLVSGLAGTCHTAMQARVVATKEDGTRRNITLDFAGAGSYTSATGGSNWFALAQLPTGDAIARSSTALKRIDLITGFGASDAWGTGTIPTTVRATAPIVGPNDGALVLGDGGVLHAGVITPTPSITDYSAKIRPVALLAMDKGGTVAVGKQGNVYHTTNGTDWKALPTRHVQDLHAVHYRTSPATVIAAGASGTCFTMDPAVPGTVHDLVLPVQNDLFAVRAQTNALTIGGSFGTLLYTANYTATAPVFDVVPANMGAIRALASRPSAADLLAVGDGALVHSTTAGVRTPRNDVFTPGLNAVDFHDGLHGYVVGEERVARYTADGGQHWQVVPGPASDDADDLYALNAVDVNAASEAWVVGDAGTAAKLLGTTWTSNTDFNTAHNLTTVAHVASGARVVAGINGDHGVFYHRNAGSTGSFTEVGITDHPAYATWAFAPYTNADNSIDEEILVGGDNQSCTKVEFHNGAHTGHPAVPFPDDENDDPAVVDIRAFWFHDRVVGYAGGLDGRMYRAADDNTISHSSFGWHNEAVDDIADNIDGQSLPNCDIATIGFSERFNGFIGGQHSPGMERYARTWKDEIGLFSARYWYDAVGRIVLSQNTKQKQATPQRYSYTLYDKLGRTYEAGEVDDVSDPLSANAFRNAVPGILVGGSFDPSVLDAEILKGWILGSNQRREITRTWYDTPLENPDLPSGFVQNNLRLRVATTTYQEVYNADPTVYAHATHYSYDIHGNVQQLIQDHPAMDVDAGNVGHRFKRLYYVYDLISGNVKEVWYQHRKPDAFYHKYAYDADNRIITVKTSVDRLTWSTDAEYFYYPHGPLERVELGTNTVQGVDYAYTLQGWLKGINSDRLLPANDMGHDGLAASGNDNSDVGRDVFGESIGYYGETDYSPINDVRWNNTTGERPFAPQAWTVGDGWAPLHNGNIAHTVNTLAPFDAALGTSGWSTSTTAPIDDGQVLAQVYRYDQLNRLRESRGYNGLDADNDWALATASAPNLYGSSYTFDANGNMASAARYDDTGTQYDDFTYKYEGTQAGPTAPIKKGKNRLYELYDNENGTIVSDIAHHPDTDPTTLVLATANVNQTTNYLYDALGNQVHDTQGDIDNVEWLASGKVKRIEHIDPAHKPLSFGYDAGGNRILKQVGDDPTGSGVGFREYFVRDAQGNIMAVYKFDNASGYSLRLKERPIYGSSRLGSYNKDKQLYGLNLLTPPTSIPPAEAMQVAFQRYDLSDHLGNVTAVVTGQLLPGGAASTHQPKLITASAYEPYGTILHNRSYHFGQARMTFQGQVFDEEIFGVEGTAYSFKYRVEDARGARFWSIDPLAAKYPWNSPYAFAENKVIQFVELEGLETKRSRAQSDEVQTMPASSTATGAEERAASLPAPEQIAPEGPTVRPDPGNWATMLKASMNSPWSLAGGRIVGNITYEMAENAWIELQGWGPPQIGGPRDFEGMPISYTRRQDAGMGTAALVSGPLFGYAGALNPLAESFAYRAITNPAHSVGDAVRLNNQLLFEEAASIFTSTGELTPQILNRAQIVIANPGNPLLPPGLAKYITPTTPSPAGPFQVHFYMDPSTKIPYYGRDYKIVFKTILGTP